MECKHKNVSIIKKIKYATYTHYYGRCLECKRTVDSYDMIKWTPCSHIGDL